MSVEASSAVWKHSTQGGDALLVLLAIADCAKSDGTGAWPSTRTLARMTRIAERSVRRIVRRLEEAGELATRIAAGPGGTNLYDVCLTGLKHTTSCRGEDKKTGGDIMSGGDSPVPTPRTAGSSDPSLIRNFDLGADEKPAPTPKKPKTTKSKLVGDALYTPLFCRFWDAYPLKDGKQDAAEVWHRYGLEKASPEFLGTILAGVERYKATPRVAEGFVMHARRWLHGRHWQSEYATPAPRPVVRRATPGSGATGAPTGERRAALREFVQRTRDHAAAS